MVRRLPNLNQLRAFEAAARLGSFKEAAEELFVTQAAISHQIKALEEHFGQPLFHRLTRKVRLTDAAIPYAARLSELFDELEEASTDLSGQEMAGEITLTVAPIYGNRIILPRLEAFHALYPEIRVRMVPSSGFVDLRKSEFDGGIRIGRGDWAGLTALHLHQVVHGPVASRDYLGNKSLPIPPAEIVKMKLATVTGRENDWIEWFRFAGLETDGPFDSIEYGNPALAMDLAVSGLGASLSDFVLSHEDVRNDKLVRLSDKLLRHATAMYLVFPTAPLTDPRLIAFADWLRGEVRALVGDEVDIGEE